MAWSWWLLLRVERPAGVARTDAMHSSQVQRRLLPYQETLVLLEDCSAVKGLSALPGAGSNGGGGGPVISSARGAGAVIPAQPRRALRS